MAPSRVYKEPFSSLCNFDALGSLRRVSESRFLGRFRGNALKSCRQMALSGPAPHMCRLEQGQFDDQSTRIEKLLFFLTH